MDKKIDETWKNNAENEKKSAAEPDPFSSELKASFPLFISSLGMQALLALGELEDPVSKTKKTDLKQACYLIDIMEILREKTSANATNEEKQMLEDLLYQLRIAYLKKLEAEKQVKS